MNTSALGGFVFYSQIGNLDKKQKNYTQESPVDVGFFGLSLICASKRAKIGLSKLYKKSSRKKVFWQGFKKGGCNLAIRRDFWMVIPWF